MSPAGRMRAQIRVTEETSCLSWFSLGHQECTVEHVFNGPLSSSSPAVGSLRHCTRGTVQCTRLTHMEINECGGQCRDDWTQGLGACSFLPDALKQRPGDPSTEPAP